MEILPTILCVIFWFTTVELATAQFNISSNNSSVLDADVEKSNYSGLPPETLIVGGVPALKHEFPALVNLRIDGMFCGGSLIALDTVLTAAHCMITDRGTVVDPSKVVAVAGDHHLAQNDGTEQNATARVIRVHENYNPRNFVHDIALIKLQRNFTSIPNGPVRPIGLPQQNANITGNSTTGVVAGWGTTREGGTISLTLMKVEVPLVTNQSCTSQMTNSAGQFCAGISGKDSCQGDSGGPFLCSSNQSLVCGIVSYGQGCGLPNKPGVYTKTSSYATWINANMEFQPTTTTASTNTTTTPKPSSSHTLYPASLTLMFLTVITYKLQF